jgi:hypothetical protein
MRARPRASAQLVQCAQGACVADATRPLAPHFCAGRCMYTRAARRAIKVVSRVSARHTSTGNSINVLVGPARGRADRLFEGADSCGQL